RRAPVNPKNRQAYDAQGQAGPGSARNRQTEANERQDRDPQARQAGEETGQGRRSRGQAPHLENVTQAVQRAEEEADGDLVPTRLQEKAWLQDGKGGQGDQRAYA